MKFKEKNFLLQKDSNDQGEDQEVETFLVGEESIADWTQGQCHYGSDYCRIYPAWVEGKRAWLLEMNWQPARGYCARGTSEEIIDFDEGITLIIDRGLFDVFFQNYKDSNDQD